MDVHGLIHIGLALEFRQPLLLAEGHAQAASASQHVVQEIP